MIYMMVTRSARNIPIVELHNYCMEHDLELDVDEEEIIILEVTSIQ